MAAKNSALLTPHSALPPAPCHVAGCARRVSSAKIFCHHHWFSLPLLHRQEIERRHGRPRMRAIAAAKIYLAKLETGRATVLDKILDICSQK